MAKIVYFISPIDESKQREIISKGTLRFALKELGIEIDPLCVTINGMTKTGISIHLFSTSRLISNIKKMQTDTPISSVLVLRSAYIKIYSAIHMRILETTFRIICYLYSRSFPGFSI